MFSTLNSVYLLSGIAVGSLLTVLLTKNSKNSSSTVPQTSTVNSSELLESVIFEDSDGEDEEEDEDLDDDKIKMVLIIRSDLKMETGKKCSQAAHCSLGAYRNICKKYIQNPKEYEGAMQHVKHWLRNGCAKIVLKVQSLQEMKDIKLKSKNLKIPYYEVMDAGLTQIESGSITVCAVGPAPSSLVNQVTGKLKLL